ncbi:MAG: twin-arginine translocase TatA/TatE family subunit [Chloroflexota bacterium]
MPFNLGGPELIIVLVIVLIVFGAGKLPNVMRDMGRGVKEFKKAQTEEEIAAEAAARADSSQTTSPTLSTNAPAGAPSVSAGASATGVTNGQVARTAEPAPRA